MKKSDITKESIRNKLTEERQDLATFDQRSKESTISYEALLRKLKAEGKIKK